MCNLLVDIFAEISLDFLHRWLAIGDGNEIPGDSCIQTIIEANQGSILSTGIPTRFEGTHEIDWGVTNFSTGCKGCGPRDVVLSDHKVVQFLLTGFPLDLFYGNIKTTFNWSKPDQVSVSEWRKSLRKAWLFGNHLTINWDTLGVQESWDLFMKALNSMFFLALQEQVTLGNISFTEFQSRVKGAVPKQGIPIIGKKGFGLVPEGLSLEA